MTSTLLCALMLAAGLARPQAACELAPTFIDAAQAWQLDPLLLVSVAEVETGFRDDCVRGLASCYSLGNVGLMQIQPRFSGTPTHLMPMDEEPHALAVDPLTRAALHDPHTSIHTAARLLRANWSRNGKYTPQYMVCAYNVGGLGCKSPKGQAYKKKVSRVHERLLRAKRIDELKEEP